MNYNTFIAANSSKGFVSFFDDLFNIEKINKIYLIKGGPGCGKSTFMKKVADAAEKAEYTVERIHCSSDPDSLDGIVIEQIKTAIIDATPPHTYDMKYPGVFESIIDFSSFWDEQSLINTKKEIIETTNQISNNYNQVYGVLRSAGLLYEQLTSISESFLNKEKILKLIKKTVEQNTLTPVESYQIIKRRFYNSINGAGKVSFSDTPEKLCNHGIIIDDDIMAAGNILTKFLAYFKKRGYGIIVYFNPLCPDTKIDHLIIPQLNFGIFSSNPIFRFDLENNDFKHINIKNYIDKNAYILNKNKITFRKKLINELLDSAISDLQNIKNMHDLLEQYYINSVDYEKINIFTKNFIQKIVTTK